jgi:hypothetical protein
VGTDVHTVLPDQSSPEDLAWSQQMANRGVACTQERKADPGTLEPRQGLPRWQVLWVPQVLSSHVLL